MCSFGNICQLSVDVVNRIAAGEVIHRPFSALKEMLENSIDAKSSVINVTVKDGGLKLLQIQDDGCGISREDFEIICERFTTSKLRKFEDLQTLTTFGFRGEALASISHVAYVTILSRLRGQQCAYKGTYIDGKLTGTPTPCAATEGTTIIVENLFFNMPIRRKALRSPSEEHSKIVDLVRKYAIHNSQIAFSVKRTEGMGVDLRTNADSTRLANIALLYGSSVSKECVEFSLSEETPRFNATGFLAVTASIKALCLILFINNRLVECRNFKRGLDHLARGIPKNSNLFVYISLELDPETVDVNIHPTKEEVRFLHESEILEKILFELERKIVQCCSTRTFTVATPAVTASTAAITEKLPNTRTQDLTKSFSVIRSDSREQKLETVMNKSQHLESSPLTMFGFDSSNASKMNSTDASTHNDRTHGEVSDIATAMDTQLQSLTSIRPDIKLTSVISLQQSICHSASKELRGIISKHVFVGCVDPKYCLVQHASDLLLLDVERLSEELFYQSVLMKFGNLGVLRLSEPFPLFDLLVFAISRSGGGSVRENQPKESVRERVGAMVSKLMSKADMLWDYFSMQLEENSVKALPCLLKGYVPQLEGLPSFLYQLATEVNWDDELDCFQLFARAIGAFYSLKREYCCDNRMSAVCDDNAVSWSWTVEHCLCPEFKLRLLVSERTGNSAILKLADSHQLYKVFERC